MTKAEIEAFLAELEITQLMIDTLNKIKSKGIELTLDDIKVVE